MPFFEGTDFDPLVTSFEMPSFDSLREALFTHMRAGALPMAKSAAHMAPALTVALKADKDPVNFMGPVSSPWPAFSINIGDNNGNRGQVDPNQSFDDIDDQIDYGAPLGNGKAPTGTGKAASALGAQT